MDVSLGPPARGLVPLRAWFSLTHVRRCPEHVPVGLHGPRTGPAPGGSVPASPRGLASCRHQPRPTCRPSPPRLQGASASCQATPRRGGLALAASVLARTCRCLAAFPERLQHGQQRPRARGHWRGVGVRSPLGPLLRGPLGEATLPELGGQEEGGGKTQPLAPSRCSLGGIPRGGCEPCGPPPPGQPWDRAAGLGTPRTMQLGPQALLRFEVLAPYCQLGARGPPERPPDLTELFCHGPQSQRSWCGMPSSTDPPFSLHSKSCCTPVGSRPCARHLPTCPCAFPLTPQQGSAGSPLEPEDSDRDPQRPLHR